MSKSDKGLIIFFISLFVFTVLMCIIIAKQQCNAEIEERMKKSKIDSLKSEIEYLNKKIESQEKTKMGLRIMYEKEIKKYVTQVAFLKAEMINNGYKKQL